MKEFSVGTAKANDAAVPCLRESLSSRAFSPALCLIATAAVLAALAVSGGEALGQTGYLGDDAALLSGDLSPQSKLNVSFDTGSFDRYVWRGLVLTAGPVLQPAVTVTRGELSVNVAGNLDLDDINGNQSEFNEIDVTLAWTRTVGACDLSAGVINYNFPNTPAVGTTELYVSASFDIPAKPAINAYFDVDAANGTYLTLNVGHSFSSEYANPIAWELTLDTGIGLGSAEYNSLYFGSATDGTTDFHVGLSFAVKIHNKWTVSQHIIYTSIVDPLLRAAIADDETIAYGMVLTVEF